MPKLYEDDPDYPSSRRPSVFGPPNHRPLPPPAWILETYELILSLPNARSLFYASTSILEILRSSGLFEDIVTNWHVAPLDDERVRDFVFDAVDATRVLFLESGMSETQLENRVRGIRREVVEDLKGVKLAFLSVHARRNTVRP